MFVVLSLAKFQSQKLNCIEKIHSRHVIHRDLKPDNLLIGVGHGSHQVHIIDFSLSKLYRDPQTNIHIGYHDGLPLIGTTHFASINAQIGIELSRHDDIESLAYILIYFLHGSLPWQDLKFKGKKHQAEVRKKKLTTTIDVLCAGLPIEFALCLQYARSLKFTERPDYQYLHDLFLNLRKQSPIDDLEFSAFGTLSCSWISTPPPVIGSNSTEADILHVYQRSQVVEGIKRCVSSILVIICIYLCSMLTCGHSRLRPSKVSQAT